MKKFCIFDLDGTLVYTIGDIAAALNHGLAEYGYPAMTEPAVAAIVGYSTNYMFQHAVPENAGDDWKRVGESYQAYYKKHCCDTSHPYDGVLKTLIRLKNEGVRLAVVSNKPHRDSLHVIETLFPRDLFSLVLGRMEKFPTKPSPEVLRFALETLGAAPEDAVYVGDSEVDVRFAANAGLDCLAVSWGYRTRAQLTEAGAATILDEPADIPAHVLGA